MWKSAIAMSGALSVTTLGAQMMLWLSVVSLDILLMVCILAKLQPKAFSKKLEL